MTPAQQAVQTRLEELRFARNMPCPHCDEGCDSAPCYCFDNIDSTDRARKRLKEAKRARKIEKRALATTSTP